LKGQPRLALGGIGNKMKECKEMVDSCGCWQHFLLGRLGNQSNHQFHGGLVASFYSGCTLDILQVAQTIPKWPIESPGLALSGNGNKMKECKEMVDACGCWQHVLLGKLGTQPNHEFHVGLVGRS